MKKQLTMEEIIEHKEFESSKQKVRDIESRVEGRIMSTSNKCINILYILAKTLGSKLKTYVELGVLHGGSMALVKMAMVRKKSGKMIGVDLFDGFDRKAHIDPVSKMEITNQVATRNLRIFGKDNLDIKFIKGDAADDATIEAVKNETGKKINLLFIDCDFKKENLVKMFTEYSKLVSSGGIILFGNYKRNGYNGVAEAIDEITFKGWEEIGQYKMYYIVQKKGSMGRPRGVKTARTLQEKLDREVNKNK